MEKKREGEKYSASLGEGEGRSSRLHHLNFSQPVHATCSMKWLGIESVRMYLCARVSEREHFEHSKCSIKYLTVGERWRMGRVGFIMFPSTELS